jgi:hypothetical protein
MNARIPLIILAAFLAAACGPPAERDDSGNIVSRGAIDAFAMKIGDCFNDSPALLTGDETTEVRGVPCDQPHDNEVFALFDVTFTEYPGEESMSERAIQACIKRFEAFVGAPYETSELDTFPLYPGEASWSQLNDREVICSLYRVDEQKLTGTMKDAGI